MANKFQSVTDQIFNELAAKAPKPLLIPPLVEQHAEMVRGNYNWHATSMQDDHNHDAILAKHGGKRIEGEEFGFHLPADKVKAYRKDMSAAKLRYNTHYWFEGDQHAEQEEPEQFGEKGQIKDVLKKHGYKPTRGGHHISPDGNHIIGVVQGHGTTPGWHTIEGEGSNLGYTAAELDKHLHERKQKRESLKRRVAQKEAYDVQHDGGKQYSEEETDSDDYLEVSLPGEIQLGAPVVSAPIESAEELEDSTDEQFSEGGYSHSIREARTHFFNIADQDTGNHSITFKGKKIKGTAREIRHYLHDAMDAGEPYEGGKKVVRIHGSFQHSEEGVEQYAEGELHRVLTKHGWQKSPSPYKNKTGYTYYKHPKRASHDTISVKATGSEWSHDDGTPDMFHSAGANALATHLAKIHRKG